MIGMLNAALTRVADSRYVPVCRYCFVLYVLNTLDDTEAQGRF